ncbi:MAG: hypothetical protein WC877_01135 [Dehalococcoidales bacterium]|jgi:hypothetical protein
MNDCPGDTVDYTTIKIPLKPCGKYVNGYFIPEGSNLKVFRFECNECGRIKPCRYSKVGSIGDEINTPSDCPNHHNIANWSKV